jgi:hypothetical protein
MRFIPFLRFLILSNIKLKLKLLKNRDQLDNVPKTGVYTCSKFDEWVLKRSFRNSTLPFLGLFL